MKSATINFFMTLLSLFYSYTLFNTLSSPKLCLLLLFQLRKINPSFKANESSDDKVSMMTVSYHIQPFRKDCDTVYNNPHRSFAW